MPVSLHLSETYRFYVPRRRCTSSDCFMFGNTLLLFIYIYIYIYIIYIYYIYIYIGFTLLYFKMAMMPLVLETKMADIGKLISLGNLLVRKVTTTSATLILSCTFGADCMTMITYIYSRLPSTHSFPFGLRETTHTLSLSIATYRDNTRSLLHFEFQKSTPRKCIHSATFFFFFLPLQ